MNREQVQDWIQIVGLFAVVASLIFVGVEVRQSSRAAMDASLVGDIESIIALEELVTSQSDIWLRGCKGEELSEEELLIFTHVFHTYQYQYFLRWLRSQRGVTSAQGNITVDNIAMNIHRHVGIRGAWDTHFELRTHLPDGIQFHQFRDAVNARVAEFAEFEPEPRTVHARCGLN